MDLDETWQVGLRPEKTKPCTFPVKSRYGFRREREKMGRRGVAFCHVYDAPLLPLSFDRFPPNFPRTRVQVVSRDIWFHIPKKFPRWVEFPEKPSFYGTLEEYPVCAQPTGHEKRSATPRLFPSPGGPPTDLSFLCDFCCEMYRFPAIHARRFSFATVSAMGKRECLYFFQTLARGARPSDRRFALVHYTSAHFLVSVALLHSGPRQAVTKSLSTFRRPSRICPRTIVVYHVYRWWHNNIPEKHGLSCHFYADDLQLYISCRRGRTSVCANRVSVYIEDITRWMASNRLVVNPAKTDVLWCSSSQPLPGTPLLHSGTTVQPSAIVRNLGVLFDTDLSLAAHVTQLTARCYSSLRRIKSCRRALTRSASVTLVNSFIVSKLDYCNSLLAVCNKQLVDKLQRVLNCAARVISVTVENMLLHCYTTNFIGCEQESGLHSNCTC